MDEFTLRIEELNSKINARNTSDSQQNLALQTEACNGSVPNSLFITVLGNGSLTGAMLPHSSSSSQLAKDSPLMEEILVIARAQRQIMHQLDSLSNIVHEYWGERTRQARIDNTIPVLLHFSCRKKLQSLSVQDIRQSQVIQLRRFPWSIDKFYIGLY